MLNLAGLISTDHPVSATVAVLARLNTARRWMIIEGGTSASYGCSSTLVTPRIQVKASILSLAAPHEDSASQGTVLQSYFVSLL